MTANLQSSSQGGPKGTVDNGAGPAAVRLGVCLET
jgi:hypothetical protein